MYEELVKRLRELPHLLSLFHNQEDVVYQAVDAIEELEEKVQVYAETLYAYEHPWISVTEQLPEDKKEIYLCYTDLGAVCECRWTNNRFGMGDSDLWGWNIIDVPRYQEVTHWMPLPQPPEMDESEDKK